jgi:hypothetical protein
MRRGPTMARILSTARNLRAWTLLAVHWRSAAYPTTHMPPTGWSLGDLATTIAPYDPLIKGQVLTSEYGETDS